MRFADIEGHLETKARLIKSVKNNQVAHAQLFSGTEGCPNLSMAIALATFLNCTDRKPEDSCGKCPSCIKTDKLIHPDLHFVFPVSTSKGSDEKKVKASDVVSGTYIREWREFLGQTLYGTIVDWSNFYGAENKQSQIGREESRQVIRNLALKSFEGEYKITIIWYAELMNHSAANALLKIIEEPPEKTVFLMVTMDQEKLLSTILSRVRVVGIRPFSDEEIATVLHQQRGLDGKRATQVAHLVNGNLNEALRIASETPDDTHGMFRDWMRLCYSRDFENLTQWADRFGGLSKVGQKGLLQYGLEILRNSLIFNYEQENLIRLESEEREFVEKFHKVMSPQRIEHLSQGLEKACYHLERNANSKILFLDLSLSISRLFHDS